MRALALVCVMTLGCGGASTCRLPAGVRGYDDGGGTGLTSDGGMATGCAASRTFTSCVGETPSTQVCTALCTPSQFSLGCYGEVVPPASFGCSTLNVSGPEGSSFYCCPCAP